MFWSFLQPIMQILVYGKSGTGKTQFINKLAGRSFSKKWEPSQQGSVTTVGNNTFIEYASDVGNFTTWGDKPTTQDIDAVIIFCDGTQKFSISDIPMLITRINTWGITNIVIIINKIDLSTPRVDIDTQYPIHYIATNAASLPELMATLPCE